MAQQENFIWYDPVAGLPVVSIGPAGVSINASGHRVMGRPQCIRIGIDPDAGLLAIKPAADDEAGAVALSPLGRGRFRTPRKSVVRMIQEYWPNVPVGRSSRYMGRWDAAGQMLLVDLSRPLAELRTKSRDQANRPGRV